jgi:hypothetical protein
LFLDESRHKDLDLVISLAACAIFKQELFGLKKFNRKPKREIRAGKSGLRLGR